MGRSFSESDLNKLYRPGVDSSGEDNGQVTFIGGSELFHGPPVLILKTISRVVDMVFFASPYEPMHDVAVNLKSQIGAFIWVPWDEVDLYIEKSDACLIGPGLMRFHKEGINPDGKSLDGRGEETRKITEKILTSHRDKKWVIDAGSLQVMDPNWIPESAIITPNKKEYGILFGDKEPEIAAKEQKCFIVTKGRISRVYGPDGDEVHIEGGNPGMTKGGTGDIVAGLTAALLAKNEPMLAAAAASLIAKKAADNLAETVGVYYSADDLAEEIPRIMGELLNFG